MFVWRSNNARFPAARANASLSMHTLNWHLVEQQQLFVSQELWLHADVGISHPKPPALT